MGKLKTDYKQGDRVTFTFLSEVLQGEILKISNRTPVGSSYNRSFLIYDGKYKYPTKVENILNVVEKK